MAARLGRLSCSMDWWMLEVDGSILMSHSIRFVMVKFKIVISPNPLLLSISLRYFSRKMHHNKYDQPLRTLWWFESCSMWGHEELFAYDCTSYTFKCERSKVSVGWNEMVLNPRAVSSMMDIDTIKLQHTLCKLKVQTWEHLIAKNIYIQYGHWLTIKTLVEFSEIKWDESITNLYEIGFWLDPLAWVTHIAMHLEA